MTVRIAGELGAFLKGFTSITFPIIMGLLRANEPAPTAPPDTRYLAALLSREFALDGGADKFAAPARAGDHLDRLDHRCR